MAKKSRCGNQIAAVIVLADAEEYSPKLLRFLLSAKEKDGPGYLPTKTDFKPRIRKKASR